METIGLRLGKQARFFVFNKNRLKQTVAEIKLMVIVYLLSFHAELSVSSGRIKTRAGTFGISYEDCYAREISHFVCNICLP